MGLDLRGGCTVDIRHAGMGIEGVDKEDEMKKCLYCDGSGVQDNLGWDLPKSCQPCCVHCDGEGYVSNLKYVYHKVRELFVAINRLAH